MFLRRLKMAGSKTGPIIWKRKKMMAVLNKLKLDR